ncbi:hypothetical protein BH11PAT1_BH11PAT1_7130 [soil metagenome]
MRIFTYSIIFCSFFLFCLFSSSSLAFAATTPFRSARIVTSDGNVSYINWSNCSLTDGQTCDRSPGLYDGNLNFRDFGTYAEYGIPHGAKITHVRIRVTGKATATMYVALSPGTTFTSNCQSPSFLWELWQLVGSTIATQTFVSPVIDNSSQSVGAYCLKETDFATNNFIWRINYTNNINWSANIDNFELAFDYDPPPLPPAKTPLISIPGIGGSELKAVNDTVWSSDDGHGGTFTHIYPANEKIWVNTIEAARPGSDDYFDILRMDSDGNSEANIAFTGNLFASYQPTIDFFTTHGYTLNTNFFVFPYDWRKDIAHTKSLLDEKISAIKQSTGAQKVDIVAHSMGGLVARNYIADATKAPNVRKLFTLGTPHFGAVKFLKAVMYGDCQTIFEILKKPLCFGISPTAVKDVLQNMTSGYELAPSKTYFSFYTNNDSDHPYPFVDMRDIDNNGITGFLNYSQTKTLMSNLGHNTDLFTPSETFHALDETLANTNGVDITLIAGSGIATIGQIVEKNIIDFLGITIPKKDEMQINGDETVPLYSASLSDLASNLSLIGNAKVYYTKQTHGDLPVPGPALDLVSNILTNNTQIPAGASTQPFYFKRKGISSHSPVNLHVYDALGNHTGTTEDGFEKNIPGSQYDTLDDAKFIFLPEDGIYTVKLDATDKGSFDLLIRDYEDNKNTKTTFYKNVPIIETTKVETLLDTSLDTPPLLSIDNNGDGEVDSHVAATSQAVGAENNDHTPPITTIHTNGTKGTNDWFTSDIAITLGATDDISGVSNTTYTVNNGTTITTYTEPFSLTNDGIYTLKVKSIDNAGNEENPQVLIIKIDKTPPEAKIFIDQDLQDLIVQGIDTNSVTINRQDNKLTKKKDNTIYLITDTAGNTLQLDVRDRDKDKQDRFGIYSLTYNANSPIVLDNNHYNVTYQGKKAKLNINEQNFDIKGDIKIRIQYDLKNNKSTIITKEGKQEKVKEVKSGVTILQLMTNQGVLQYSY